MIIMSEDEVEISIASNNKGRNSGERKRSMHMFCRNLVVAIEKSEKKKN